MTAVDVKHVVPRYCVSRRVGAQWQAGAQCALLVEDRLERTEHYLMAAGEDQALMILFDFIYSRRLTVLEVDPTELPDDFTRRLRDGGVETVARWRSWALASPPILPGETEPVIGGVPGLTLWNTVGLAVGALVACGAITMIIVSARDLLR